MKIATSYLMALLLVTGLWAQQHESIAVLDLEGRGISAIEAATLTDRMRSELVKTGAVTVVERGLMVTILAEQDFQMTGCSSDECAVEVGQLLGVTMMCSGSIGKIGSTYTVDVRTISTQTGAIVSTISRNYRGEIDGLITEIEHLAWDLVGLVHPDEILGQLRDEPIISLKDKAGKGTRREKTPPTKAPTTWVEAADRVLSSSRAKPTTKPPAMVDRTPPSIQITSPAITRGMKKVQQEKTIVVRGKATDKSGIFEVLVNGVEARVEADGSFWAEVKLAFGENRIAVKATDMKDNSASTAFMIVREAGSRPAPVVAGKPDHIVLGKYYALIIGIDSYSGEWPRLKNAVHDAKGVKEVLESQYRFDHIETLLNQEATRAGIITKLEWLAEELQEDDNLLIYYSGHGEFKEKLNKGYWVPVDATGKSTANYVSNADLQTFLNGIRTRHTLLISDACFSGDIFRSRTTSLSSDDFDNMDRYFQEVYNRSSRQAITSGGIEPVMDGGRDGHSVFTYYFLRALKQNSDPYYDAGQVFERLKIPVANNSEQTPILQAIKNTGDEGGQFIFVRKR